MINRLNNKAFGDEILKPFINHMKYARLIAILFAFIILLGAALLTLPIASRSGISTPFIDTLFTATSSNCVTGLIVYDTYSHWSLFGQIVILLLIQIGGLGFMSLATIFALILKRKIGLKNRMLLQESAGSFKLGGVVKLTKHILLGTLIIEGLGAVLLAFRFCPKMGFWEGLYNAVFHSVSAFCNAGFDLMGKYKQFSSLTTFGGDPYVCLIIASLIVIGGLGFLVWEDIYTHKWRYGRYMLHTKVVLFTTAVLIAAGAVLIFVVESDDSMVNMNIADRIVNSVFQSVTPRTAGFNSVDMSLVSDSTIFLTIILMIIGGSPGSTAGGIKTTTAFIMLAATISTLKNKSDISAFRRRFEESMFKKACTILVIYAGISVSGIALISLFQNLPLKDVVFEVFSAIGTVGISLGITPELSEFSKLVIILLMYFGRVGVLSIIFAFIKTTKPVPLQYPQEKLMIG